MPSAGIAPVQGQSRSMPHERPWLFAFLIAPDAVISLGLVGGAITYLLRDEGVAPGRAASIAALLSLPHAIYFLWGPLTDFWMRRRTWLLLAAAASAIAMVVAFRQPRLASPWAVGLLFLSACLGVFVVAACGGILGTLHSELSRRRAGSFYQSGSLTFGAVAVFVLVTCSGRLSLSSLGWIIAAMIVLPSLAALSAPAQPLISEQTARHTAARIWHEFRSTFLRWEAIPYTLLVASPCCSGAMIGLLTQLARDYGVTGYQVAWTERPGRRSPYLRRRACCVAHTHSSSSLPSLFRSPALLTPPRWPSLPSALCAPQSTSQAPFFFSSPSARATPSSPGSHSSSSAAQARAAARAMPSSTLSATFLSPT